MVLQADTLSFGYIKNEPVLQNISLAVESGERLGIIAPSGTGKTTLCSLLSGYLKPWKGGVFLREGESKRPVYGIRGYCPVQMILQHPEKAVNPRLRMRDTLGEGGEEPDLSRLAEALGIERDWLDRFPSELSGGELQRFCIARALGRETRFVIADEISAMLDMITQAQIWQFLLEETARRHIGLMVVSHDASLMARVAPNTISLVLP